MLSRIFRLTKVLKIKTSTFNNKALPIFHFSENSWFNKFKRGDQKKEQNSDELLKKNDSKVDNESPKDEEKEQVGTKKEITPKSEEAKVIEKEEENIPNEFKKFYREQGVPKSRISPHKTKNESEEIDEKEGSVEQTTPTTTTEEPQKFDHKKTKNKDESHEEKEEEQKKQNDTKNKKNGEKEEIPLLDQRIDVVLVNFFEYFRDKIWKRYSNLIILALGGLFLFDLINFYFFQNVEPLSYQEFYDDYLTNGKVDKIYIIYNKGDMYTKTFAEIILFDGTKRIISIMNPKNFVEAVENLVAEKKIQKPIIEYDYTSEPYLKYYRLYLTIVAIAAFFLILKTFRGLKNEVSKMSVNDIFGISRSKAKLFTVDSNIKVKFSDVAGLNEAKLEISEFVDFLKKPKKFKELGARLPKGALLSGPPGTGKTMLAKACAGEAGVPFLYVSGSDFVEMFVGVGAARVRDLFQTAKEKAPAMIFIDEIDAVGRKRDSNLGGNDERDNTLNQLLVEMDGFGTDSQVVVLAATNRKELLDPALTRPGRFDRTVEISLPDLDGRYDIFMVHLKKIKLHPCKTIEEYAKRLATLTPGFSGADIANICNEAALIAARKSKTHVEAIDFELASERVIAGLEKKKMLSEEERKTVAYHEAGHAVVSWFLPGGTPLLKITIVPRSKGALGYAQYLPNESALETKEELMDRISSILGGRLAEEIFIGKVTTGAYDDLEKVFNIAKALVTKLGMSEKIGFVAFPDPEYYRKVSNKTQQLIDEEVMKIIDKCEAKGREIIITHKDKLELLAKALLEKNTIDLNGIVELFGDRPFPPKSNFRAYLETKKQQKEEDKISENVERKAA